MTSESTSVEVAPVRIGFVGCGPQARLSWYPNFAVMPAAELVACCDLQPALATSTARHFGAERSYADLAEMLAR